MTVTTVEVVLARVETLDAPEGLLDDAERARADAFSDAGARARFVTAHALLRTVVGARIGVPAQHVRVRQTCADCGGPHGCPQVDGVHVSQSSSGDLVVVAVCLDVPVGVDIETVSATGFPGFDDVALTGDERAALAATSAVDRSRLRALWWTRKEAVLKARGVGLRTDPRSVSVHPPSPAMAEVRVPEGYVCSVAVTAGRVHISDAWAAEEARSA